MRKNAENRAQDCPRRPLYVVTATSKLTGEKMQISRPMELYECSMAMESFERMNRYKRNKSYAKLRVELWQAREAAIDFGMDGKRLALASGK